MGIMGEMGILGIYIRTLKKSMEPGRRHSTAQGEGFLSRLQDLAQSRKVTARRLPLPTGNERRELQARRLSQEQCGGSFSPVGLFPLSCSWMRAAPSHGRQASLMNMYRPCATSTGPGYGLSCRTCRGTGGRAGKKTPWRLQTDGKRARAPDNREQRHD